MIAGLSPNGYVLRMRAVDANGNAAREQQLRFRVLPPWWRTAWAYAGLCCRRAARRVGGDRLSPATAAPACVAYFAEHRRELAEQASEAKSRFLATLGTRSARR